MAPRRNRVTVRKADGSVEVVGAGHFKPKRPKRPPRRPTRKQIFYLLDLCDELGIEFKRPKTRDEAKSAIAKALNRKAAMPG